MTATIFFNNQKWIQDTPECFGVRFNSQVLPNGSVVVGFVSSDGEAHEPPSMTPQQEACYEKALEYVECVLGGTWEGDDAFQQVL